MMITVMNGAVCCSVPNVESYNIRVSRNALYVSLSLGTRSSYHR